jgi:putative flippase GtrA
MRQLITYYLVGALNTAFGYGVYAFLVFAGVNMFLAQLMATVIGVLFNYFTYSRAVFRTKSGSVSQFVMAYVVQYLINLGSLMALSKVIADPYVAGLIALLFTSLLFYLLLKKLVFRETAGGDQHVS